jgi:two-component sensor histidine kinase/CheY-like chemotaxis protein
MRSWSIRTWLNLLVVVTVLPFAVLVAAFTFSNALESRARELDRVQQTVRALMTAVEGRFQSRIAMLLGLASSSALEHGDLAEFRRRAETALRSLPDGSDIVLSDASGQQLLNTSVPQGAALPARGNTFGVTTVFATGRPVVSNLFRDAVSQRLHVGVDVPVFVGGQLRYGLGLVIPLEELAKLIEEQKIPPGWFVGVLDRDGVLAARSPAPERFVGTPATARLREGIRRQPEGNVETPTLEGTPVISIWSRSDTTGWAFALAVPRATLLAPLYRDLALLLASSLAALLVAGLLAHLLGSSIARRLVVLERRADALATADTPPHVPPGIREIDGVDRQLRAAADTIEDQRQHQLVLMAELDHRVKNILATVQALVSRTLGRSEAANSIAGRIGVLADAHGLLTRTQGRGAVLSEIVGTTLRLYLEAGAIRVAGPHVVLNARATQALALALHELATNAVKHGALSTPSGRVQVTWSLSNGGEPRFFLHWQESGGPPTARPEREGFGTTLIEKNLPSALNGSVVRDFRPEGLNCRVEAPLAEVVLEGSLSVNLPPVPHPERLQPDLAGRHILLVEDEALAAAEVSDILTQAGCVVTTASRIGEALEIAGRNSFDAAVLDVLVREQRIFPVADVLSARQVPFVFLTGYEDPRVWPENLRAKPRISKPVNAAVLCAALGDALADKAVIRVRGTRDGLDEAPTLIDLASKDTADLRNENS